MAWARVETTAGVSGGVRARGGGAGRHERAGDRGGGRGARAARDGSAAPGPAPRGALGDIRGATSGGRHPGRGAPAAMPGPPAGRSGGRERAAEARERPPFDGARHVLRKAALDFAAATRRGSGSPTDERRRMSHVAPSVRATMANEAPGRSASCAARPAIAARGHEGQGRGRVDASRAHPPGRHAGGGGACGAAHPRPAGRAPPGGAPGLRPRGAVAARGPPIAPRARSGAASGRRRGGGARPEPAPDPIRGPAGRCARCRRSPAATERTAERIAAQAGPPRQSGINKLDRTFEAIIALAATFIRCR